MRVKLREFYTPAQLAEVYSHPYDHTRWDDHKARVALTVQLGRWYADAYRATDVTDLACGDGAIARGIAAGTERRVQLGDLVAAPHLDVIGPIEETLPLCTPPQGLDLFVLTEVLEHVEDPDRLLAEIRPRARMLLLSTPDGEQPNADGSSNPEHYWGWDVSEIEAMLRAAGWRADRLVLYDTRIYYTFQIWVAL